MEQFCPPGGHRCPLYPAPDGRPAWSPKHADGNSLSLVVGLVIRNRANLRNRGAGEAVLQE